MSMSKTKRRLARKLMESELFKQEKKDEKEDRIGDGRPENWSLTAKDLYRGESPAYLPSMGEPHWTLRGQDELTPKTIEFWAKLAAKEGVNASKIGHAMLDAARIREWQGRNFKRLPD